MCNLISTIKVCATCGSKNFDNDKEVLSESPCIRCRINDLRNTSVASSSNSSADDEDEDKKKIGNLKNVLAYKKELESRKKALESRKKALEIRMKELNDLRNTIAMPMKNAPTSHPSEKVVEEVSKDEHDSNYGSILDVSALSDDGNTSDCSEISALSDDVDISDCSSVSALSDQETHEEVMTKLMAGKIQYDNDYFYD